MVAQLSYGYQMRKYLPGQRATAGRPPDVDSFVNPMRAQVSTLTFGGTETDGGYQTNIKQQGAPDVVALTTRTGGSPATNTDLAAAHAAYINSERAFQNLVSATPAAAVVTLNFKHPGIAYSLETSAPAPGTLAAATTTQPGGSYQRVGMWVARRVGASPVTPDKQLTPITTATVLADLLGIAERTFHLVNGADRGLTYDAYDIGAEVSVGLSGRWGVEVISAVTPDSTPYVWIDETDPTGHVGQMTAVDPGGGKVIDVSSLGVRFRDSAEAGGIAVVQIGEGA